MRFFALSLACTLMRVERSESNTGSERKNLFAVRRNKRFFFSCGKHHADCSQQQAYEEVTFGDGLKLLSGRCLARQKERLRIGTFSA